eukprot:gene1254-4463_t
MEDSAKRSMVQQRDPIKRARSFAKFKTNDYEEDIDSFDEDDESEDASSVGDQLNELTLKFFNVASTEELEELPRVSAALSSRIVQLRPFSSWDLLVVHVAPFDRITELPGVTSQLVWQAQDMVEEKQTTALLLQQCKKISKALVKSFGVSKNGDVLCVSKKEDFVDHLLIPRQPKGLDQAGQLKSYQLVGLNWLALLDSHNVNAILADEMGLGKTIQAIAFIVYLHERAQVLVFTNIGSMLGSPGPHLVVVPPSTNENWERELEKWCPHLSVLSYKGCSMVNSIHAENLEYSVCTSNVDDRAFLRKVKFEAVVFDEGHMLKNMNSQRYTHLMKVRARRRILLTGTPLQNNLLELMSLLGFIMPEIFANNLQVLARMFKKNAIENGALSTSLISKAKGIMMPFVLRRVKDQVLQELPAKTTEVINCKMLSYQRKQYDMLVTNCKARKKEERVTSSENGDNSSGISELNNYFMQLRKMANHPLLHRCRYTDDILQQMSVEVLKDPRYADCDSNIVFEDMEVMSDYELNELCITSPALSKFALDDEVVMQSGKFSVLHDLLLAEQQNGNRVLIFSQFTSMLNIIEKFLARLGLKYLRIDGSTPVDDRQSLIDQYSSDKSIFCFLLSTKAGSLGINLTSANVVILHDIDFNPYNDKQAEDRCHRVGQTRPVRIIRLISCDTVEQVMQQRAERKLQLEKDMTDNGLDANATVKDLMTTYLNEVE